uniref:hypothetical protein n=1 Tax=Burkholderia diffusa TaxID=488732 RepID=UPI001CC62D0E|nr:hypothetical protein [Burkholderia diffusa]
MGWLSSSTETWPTHHASHTLASNCCLATVRALSLEHHAALAALRSGYGSFDLVAVLMRTVYLSYLMVGDVNAKPDPEPFRVASTALEQCALRALTGRAWTVEAREAAALRDLLILHDEQLIQCRSHRYTDAWRRINQVAQAGVSPLADGHVLPRGSTTLFSLAHFQPFIRDY